MNFLGGLLLNTTPNDNGEGKSVENLNATSPGINCSIQYLKRTLLSNKALVWLQVYKFYHSHYIHKFTFSCEDARIFRSSVAL